MKIKRNDSEFKNILADLERLEVVATTIDSLCLWKSCKDKKLGGNNCAKLKSLELIDHGNNIEVWQLEWKGVPPEMRKGIVVVNVIERSVYGFTEQK